MLALQWEEIGMVKVMQPVDAIMAGDAGRAKYSQVIGHEIGSIFLMAGNANPGIEHLVQGGLHVGSMAAGAVHWLSLFVCDVTHQAEMRGGVVKWLVSKSGWFPGDRGVAGDTAGAKEAGMFYGLGMAGHAFGLGLVVNTIFMAIRTGGIPVFTGQREAGQVMVKSIQGSLQRIE